MRSGFGSRMEETRLLDPLLRQVLEIVDYILGFSVNSNIRCSPSQLKQILLFVRARHIPSTVYHLLVFR